MEKSKIRQKRENIKLIINILKGYLIELYFLGHSSAGWLFLYNKKVIEKIFIFILS